MTPPGRVGGARRLFAAREDEEAEAPALLVARLLEDGDSSDLAGLIGDPAGAALLPCRHAAKHGAVEAMGAEPALAAWLARHGARQLSRRSRAFWELVLGRTEDGAASPPLPRRPAAAAAMPPPASTAFWPL